VFGYPLYALGNLLGIQGWGGDAER
jgi:hypothetical protein